MAPDAPPNSTVPCSNGNRILIAEDNRTVGRVIGKILEKEGHEVRHVSNGPAALAALFNQPLDLALLAANLPGMNAMEVTHLYRFGSKGRQHLPILGLIGEVNAPMLAAWIEAGLDGCIGKPVEPTELVDAVNACLEERVSQKASLQNPNFTEIAGGPAVDPRVLGDLEKLGGPGFVDDVIAQFAADASRLLPELASLAIAREADRFRDHIHALRSCAGNVGAVGLYKLCLASQTIAARVLFNGDGQYVAQLNSEFERAIDALEQRDWRKSTPLQQAS